MRCVVAATGAAEQRGTEQVPACCSLGATVGVAHMEAVLAPWMVALERFAIVTIAGGVHLGLQHVCTPSLRPYVST